MSREFQANDYKVLDLFARNEQPGAIVNGNGQMAGESKPQHSRPLDEQMWAGTRKRHCESREHLRHLLDKHLKPHH